MKSALHSEPEAVCYVGDIRPRTTLRTRVDVALEDVSPSKLPLVLAQFQRKTWIKETNYIASLVVV